VNKNEGGKYMGGSGRGNGVVVDGEGVVVWKAVRDWLAMKCCRWWAECLYMSRKRKVVEGSFSFSGAVVDEGCSRM